MVLGVDKLKKLVKEINLVEALGPRDLENPEGAGFDLRLGEVFEISGETVLAIEKRKTVESKSVAKYKEGKSEFITIEPGDFYLGKTIESVNLPDSLAATLHPRSTTFRSGLWLGTTQIAPGYRGPLTFSIKNLGPSNVKIELGARVLHVMFWEVAGKGASYRGQWQGGRVTSKGEEKQV
ncbi:MAG: hypothetical protein WD187_00350 [Candidatus Woykebacteria bacterium]